MICNNCRKTIDNDSQFCEFCGNIVNNKKITQNQKNHKQQRCSNDINTATKSNGKTQQKNNSIKNDELIGVVKGCKNKEELNKKVWFRFVKVVYILGFIGILAGSFYKIYQDERQQLATQFLKKSMSMSLEEFRAKRETCMKDPTLLMCQPKGESCSVELKSIIVSLILYLGMCLVVFEIGRRLFYYIILGKI